MFEKSGEKIKSAAKIVFNINVVIVSIILIVGLMFASRMYYGGEIVVLYAIIAATVLFLISWITSLFITAFGDLVESNQRIAELLDYKILEIGDKKKLIDKKNAEEIKKEISEQQQTNQQVQNIAANENAITSKGQNIETYKVYYKDGNITKSLIFDFPQGLEYKEMFEIIEKEKQIKNILSISKQ